MLRSLSSRGLQLCDPCQAAPSVYLRPWLNSTALMFSDEKGSLAVSSVQV